MSGKIIRLGPEHAPRMHEIETECFSVPWSENSLRSELENPAVYYYGYFENELLCGYAGTGTVLDEGYITNVAVCAGFRRRGIAGLLISRLMELAVEKRLSFLTLEVRESNAPAIALYSGFGFRQVGLRPGYYEKPREAAILMTLYLE